MPMEEEGVGQFLEGVVNADGSAIMGKSQAI